MEYVYNFLGYDIEYQLKLFLYSVVLGAALGVFFDCLRITRVFLAYRGEGKHIRAVSDTMMCVLAFFEDIAFAVISAVALVLFCFKANGGSARSYIFIGSLFGFVVYLLSIGRLTRMISNTLAELFYRLFSFIKRRIVLPIIFTLAGFLRKIYKKTLGVAILYMMRRVYTLNMKRVSREFTKTIARLYIEKRKEYEDETNSFANAGEARSVRRFHNNDSHPRRSADRVQSA